MAIEFVLAEDSFYGGRFGHGEAIGTFTEPLTGYPRPSRSTTTWVKAGRDPDQGRRWVFAELAESVADSASR